MEERRREIISQRELPSKMYCRKNPFAAITIRPTSYSGRKKGELKLEGLITDPKQPFALINDMIVKEGDSIDGKKVIKIDIKSVTLEDEDGRRYILKLF